MGTKDIAVEQASLTAEEIQRLEAADRAGAYLYRVLDIGQAMLQCGGEVSRVEDSIRRLCFAYGAERADVFSITTSIMVTIYSPAYGVITQTRRITGGSSYNLHRLESLNQLSRRLCSAEKLTPEDMDRELKAIYDTPQYPFWLELVAYALVSASFSLFFGGCGRDAVVSGLIGIVLKYTDRMLRGVEVNALLSSLVCSCLGGLLAGLSVKVGLGVSVAMISIGNIMLLIPGVVLTNSLRDMFSGDTISGLMRFVEAVILALIIAFGFALVAGLL